jgi:hypothetical protein
MLSLSGFPPNSDAPIHRQKLAYTQGRVDFHKSPGRPYVYNLDQSVSIATVLQRSWAN